ncbi:hypothetical protein LIER_41200 [Lithospermum erythrorhizon]|uniref:Uncharacterized protein n=1 Tax=Lithospermum erythrorhizon TaxID=34254 RepID=A0AAV3R5J9_LITER
MEDEPVTRAKLEGIIAAFTTTLIALTEHMEALAKEKRQERRNETGSMKWKQSCFIINVDRFLYIMGVPENKQVKEGSDQGEPREGAVAGAGCLLGHGRGAGQASPAPFVHVVMGEVRFQTASTD